MAASAAADLATRGWATGSRIALIALLFAAAGALSFFPAVTCARALSAGRRYEARLALSLLCLAGATITAAALLYALQYRFYYAAGHAPAFSTIWVYQFAFTALAALYQFAVLGVRLFFPFGFLALLAAAFWLASRRLSNAGASVKAPLRQARSQA